jgi:uncharacterized protein YegP (UPF0339 family)
MFEIKNSSNAQFYIRIIGKNHEELFRSSETYTSKQNAKKALKALALLFNPGGGTIKVEDCTSTSKQAWFIMPFGAKQISK